METTKAKCKVCGEVEVSFFDTEDGFIVPVALAPSLSDLDKHYSDVQGESYEEQTGNKIDISFEKGYPLLSHESPDEIGFDEAKKHTLEPIECWIEKV